MASPAFTHPLTTSQRMAYRIGRGETLVLTFEPYKSEILPLWRFKTPSIARKSSNAIFEKFLQYEHDNDFIGMDMSRKFLQMGMTRAKRYANHKGGRKYTKSIEEGKVELEKCELGEKEKEKLVCSLIFREIWEKAKAWTGYIEMKEVFVKEQREWDRQQKKAREERERKARETQNEEVNVKDEAE